MTLRRRLTRLGAVVAVTIAGGAAARAETAIAIVAPGRCPPELRERIAEQIAGVADDVGWSCLSRFDQEAPFRSPAGQNDSLQFWIDLTPGTEARLTLRDGRSDRFVVRRIPLPRGLDEIGREEIGQIVRSALLAVRAAPEDTLTRAEARAAVARWSQPPLPPPAPDARRGPPPRSISLHFTQAFGAARAFASPIPVVAEVGLAGQIVRPGPMGGWLEASYQVPARYDGAPVGVALSALAARAGLQASGRLGGGFQCRLGAGGGLTRASFTPRSEGTAATAAAPGAFWYATGRVFAGLDARLGPHFVAGLTAFLDVVGADVHYDLRQPDGTTVRVLAPYRLQPGVALGIGWGR